MHTAQSNAIKGNESWPHPKAFSSIAYAVGGIRFGLTAQSGMQLALDSELRAFACSTESCDVNLQVSWTDSLEAPRSTPLFHSGGLWTLFAETTGYRFSFLSSLLGKTPYKEAWFDSEFRSGRVLLSRRYFDTDQPVYPLEYPLDEVLMIHRLSRGEGVEVHAVGIAGEDGRGHLFLGHSGAGKSTTARLWSGRPGAKILSDDRIILSRNAAGELRMHGTPWHGEARLALPISAPLSGVYFLEHGARNELEPMEQGCATAELLARCFLPFHDAEALGFAVEFLAGLPEVPHSIFRFLPDGTAIRMFERDARAA